jgi:hypothetical protein
MHITKKHDGKQKLLKKEKKCNFCKLGNIETGRGKTSALN